MAHKLPLADIQFIADFAAFCRSKGDEGYDYCNPFGCALAQFLKATDRWDAKCLPCGLHWRIGNPSGLKAWNFTIHSPLWNAVMGSDRRFAALADRLEALIADAPVVERAQ